jgi:hypothetical protein
MAGADRGTYVLPEIDDQVLVVFEHGDIGRPIVIGALWSKKQEPVEVNQSGKNQTKLIKSRSGHRIIFDDKDGAEKITIVDKTKKNKIVLDSAGKIVKLESDGDLEVIAKANVVVHANALKIGTSDGVTGKAASLLTHAAKTFGVKATSGITIGGGNTTINVSNAAATRVSGSGAGELGGAAVEPVKDPVAEASPGGGGSGGGATGGGGTGGGGASSGGTSPGSSGGQTNAVAATSIDPQTIEVVVINASGQPVSGVNFRLRLPDGSVRNGSTGSDGLIHFDHVTTPGTAHLVLPDFDTEHGASTGARTAGALLYRGGGVDVQVGQRTQVELEPRVYHGRLIGGHFDTDKTFLLPSAMTGIRLLVRFYAEHPGSNVVISGHADTVGDAQHNLCLSDERAASMAAFLTDNVEPWMQCYRGSRCSRTWGATEDRYMLSTLTGADGQPFYRASDGNVNWPALRRYQTERSLTVTGTANDDTRRALIGDYMALDGTSLPAGTHVESHGCGENHPAEGHDRGNNVDDLENRRVEIFLFEDAIDPPVPASSGPGAPTCPPPGGCDAYPEWRRRAVQTVDFRHQPGAFRGFVFVAEPNGARTAVDGVSVHLSGPTPVDGTSAGGGNVSIDNIVPGHYSVVAHKDGFSDAMVEVDVAEGAAGATVDIPLSRLPLLDIRQVTFTNAVTVNQDTQGPFPTPHWLSGRPQQSPVCYARGTTMQISAQLGVTQQPSAATTVTVQAQATIEGTQVTWTASATIQPGDTSVNVTMTGGQPLPGHVALLDPLVFTWTEIPPNQQAGLAAGTSSTTIYVTLGQPVGTAYWTMLHASCEAAANQSTDAGFLTAVFTPFVNHRLVRKVDNVALTYWLPRPTAASCGSAVTLLGRPDGAGHCGAWADFLLHVWQLHGITRGIRVQVDTTVDSPLDIMNPNSRLFLVQQWNFDTPPATDPEQYTHTRAQVHDGDQIAGLSHPGMGPNLAPPPAFYNHFITRIDGRFYDPSYGTSFASQWDWEHGSIDGLQRQNNVVAFGFFHPTRVLLEFRQVLPGQDAHNWPLIPP